MMKEEMYKIIGIDNFARDYVSDALIKENLYREEAELAVEEKNKLISNQSPWIYKAVPMSYELHDAYKDLP